MNFSLLKKNLLKYSIFLLVIFPAFSFAQVSFSEIMFDPEGSDSDREWVEIKNTSGSSINLEKYKFCDSGFCHRLYESETNFKIPGNSLGIIAKKPEKFKIDYPDFSGFILRASFSLTNSKELLELKNELGQVVSVVEYNVEIGGKDGNSFSLFGDTWKNGKATPGKENIFEEVKKKEEKESGDSGSDDEVKIDRTYVEISDMIDGKKKLKAEIIDNIPTLIAGAENEFNGRAYGITGIEIRGAEYFWTLGDGEKEYGKNIKHTFLYPGEYVLTLVVKSANFTGNTRKIVKVVEPDIEILDVDSKKNWIKLRNNYFDILKLDGWFLFVDGEKFKIPQETYILGKKEIIFPNQITRLDVRENSNIYLLFPNGQKVTKFVKENEIILKNFSIDKISENDKKEVEMFLGKKKKTSKNKKFSKRVVKKEKTENSKDNYFYRNNFNKEKEKSLEKKEIDVVGEFEVLNGKGNFAKQNFPPKNIEKTQKLILEKEENFWMENIYFIGFIFLTGFLVLTSFLINYFEQRNKKSDELNSFASEFEIEEI